MTYDPTDPHSHLTDYRHIIDKYYPRGSALGVIYNSHCQAVADLACRIISARSLNIPPDEARAAAMLHDIGIYLCHAPSIECHGQAPYICHGTLGADLLRSEGAPEKYARVAERHTGSGLTPGDAARLGLPSGRCYMPQTDLEQLICYADKFYSKSGSRQEKTLEQVRRSMERFGDESLARFDALHAKFAYSSQNC